jgi:ABC-type transport system involved in cytochrome c biogenesis permease subunit
MMRSGWIVVHVSMLLVGYAALFLSFLSSLLYLLQAHSLKSKQPSRLVSRLPALQVLDELGYKSLLLGFPFMTIGLVIGSVVAHERFGARYFADPKVVLSLVTWGVYMLLIYTRWSSGWRGRKAAYLATFAFVAAVCAWAANYLSRVHRFIAP